MLLVYLTHLIHFRVIKTWESGGYDQDCSKTHETNKEPVCLVEHYGWRHLANSFRFNTNITLDDLFLQTSGL